MENKNSGLTKIVGGVVLSLGTLLGTSGCEIVPVGCPVADTYVPGPVIVPVPIFPIVPRYRARYVPPRFSPPPRHYSPPPRYAPPHRAPPHHR